MDCVKRGRWWFHLIRCPLCDSERFIRRDVFNKQGITKCSRCHKLKHGLAINRKNKMSSDNWLYARWQKMKARCSKNEFYISRDITVCSEWYDNFLSFYNWALQNGASSELELDRINNDLGYFPENCRWITHKENCRPGGRSGKFSKSKPSRISDFDGRSC